VIIAGIGLTDLLLKGAYKGNRRWRPLPEIIQIECCGNKFSGHVQEAETKFLKHLNLCHKEWEESNLCVEPGFRTHFVLDGSPGSTQKLFFKKMELP